ncbi:hypothetical protein NLG97_g9467 [Lecanicillium saksenae]|uniref:Uncharacterized protein n=1 Tax=Lecanicillium saksenae TaxID=468837 RepID=A0ACC1QHE2_9HYPO|nr:hypothetical protein NLG97_g9467 [Lecanicillium saksenae]
MSADLFAEFNQPAAKQTPATKSQPPQLASYQSSVSVPAQSDHLGLGHAGSSAQPSPVPQQWSSFPSQPVWSPPVVPASQPVAEDDDGWGDFEVAEPTAAAQSNQMRQNQQPLAQSIAWPGTVASQAQPAMPGVSGDSFSQLSSVQQSPQPQQTAPQQQPRNILMETSFSSTAQHTLQEMDSAWSAPKPKRRNPVQSQAADPGVLFDAADFELEDGEYEGESDDEFGDFETVKPAASKKTHSVPTPAPAAPQPQSSMPSMDLLSLEDPTPAQSQPQAVSSKTGQLRFGAAVPANSEQKRSSMQGLDFADFEQQATPRKMQAKPPTRFQTKAPLKAKPAQKPANAWAAADNDDEWATWDDAPAATTIDATPEPSSWDWETTDASTVNTISDSSPPPVNVPPPSVLLSLFPELLSSAGTLFKSTSGQSSSVKEQILSNPKAVQFLQGYILLATTAARIMAGRKHRWHRDKILAKSMSISAAGSKGMKLAGVDKTQAAREDREAADVVAVWREQVGRLRSAVTVANAAAKASLKVPELSETLSAHVAKMVGTAPTPCVICGLKRDERISKVDFDVEDSFGEWWVEHWGHRACKNFWIEHEKKLRQR